MFSIGLAALPKSDDQLGEADRAAAEAKAQAAEARLANAKIEFDRSSRLIQSRSISRSDFDLAETTYRVALEDYQAARQMLEKGAIAREEDIEAQEGQVRGLEGRVVEAYLQLQDSTLRAPYDGVIAQRFVERNQNITAGQPISTSFLATPPSVGTR